MGGWIPYEKDEKNAEKIIQDSKSRKTGKCKVSRTKIQHCRSSSGKAVKAGKNCTDGKIDADRFPKCYDIEQVEQIEEEEEQILLTNGIYSMQNHKNKSI